MINLPQINIKTHNIESLQANSFKDNIKSIKNEIDTFDTSNMFALLNDYWKHISIAINNSKEVSNNTFKNQIPQKYLILGIGGSAMSGELLKIFLKYAVGEFCPEIIINRSWDIPYNISKYQCVFVCSYSGNTEETLTALEKVRKINNNIIGISSGGKLAQICIDNNYPLLKMPEGMMPRCAMFYSFFHLLSSIINQNIVPNAQLLDIRSAIASLLISSSEYQSSKQNEKLINSAFDVAKYIKNKIPIIYSAAERLKAINLRLKAQIQENANHLCFGNFFPELNHNEINGWNIPAEYIKNFIIISLTDKEDSEKINLSINNSISMLIEKGLSIIEISAEGNNLLEKLIQLIHFSDWVSYFLAIFYKIDPTPIPEISKLKNRNK
jgi:glucose/mannose-6-phosphate isomerase